MVFYWNLSESKSPQVAKTVLIILAAPNKAVDWIISIRLAISNPSSSKSPHCKRYNRHLHIQPLSLFYRKVLVSSFAFFDFHSLIRWDDKVHYKVISLFLLFNLCLDLVFWPGLGDLFVSQNPREFNVSYLVCACIDKC